MTEEFQAGDNVQLKCGGPIMTAEIVEKERHQLTCAWFLEDKEVNWKSFSIRLFSNAHSNTTCSIQVIKLCRPSGTWTEMVVLVALFSKTGDIVCT